MLTNGWKLTQTHTCHVNALRAKTHQTQKHVSLHCNPHNSLYDYFLLWLLPGLYYRIGIRKYLNHLWVSNQNTYRKGIYDIQCTLWSIIWYFLESLDSAIGFQKVNFHIFRNLTLILCFVAEILEFIVQVPNLTVFFIIRALQGTVAGLFLALIPVYVREISPK